MGPANAMFLRKSVQDYYLGGSNIRINIFDNLNNDIIIIKSKLLYFNDIE